MLTHMCGITQPPSNDYYCLSEIYGRFFRTSEPSSILDPALILFTPYFSLKNFSAVRECQALLGHAPRVFSPKFLVINNTVADAVEAHPTP